MPAAGSPAGEESGARLEEAWLILVKCTGQQYKCKLGPLGASPAVVCGFLPGPDRSGFLSWAWRGETVLLLSCPSWV